MFRLQPDSILAGTFAFMNGDVYEGDFDHNEMSGQGVYRRTDGTEARGEHECRVLRGGLAQG